MGQPYYKLNFSNYVIENAFQAYFVGSLEERSPLKVSCEMAKLHRTTLANDTATIHLVLKSHLAAIPYVKRRNTEENYHKIIYSVFVCSEPKSTTNCLSKMVVTTLSL